MSRWDSPSTSSHLRCLRPHRLWHEEVSGQAGADLCSGIVAVSTSTCHLRDHLDGLTTVVFDRGVFSLSNGRTSLLADRGVGTAREPARTQELITFQAWCCASERNEVGTSSGRTLMVLHKRCLLYTSPSPRDKRQSRMPSSA